MKRTLIAWLIGTLCATALAQTPSVQNPQPSKPFPSISSTASPVQVLGSDSIESTQNDTQSPLVLPIEELNKRVSRYGRIIDEIPMETPWLFAWLVERNGYQTTVYATPDGTHIIAGVLLNGGEQSTPSIVDQLKAKHSQAETTPLADTRASSTRSDGGTSSSTADTLAQDDDNAQNLTYAMQGQFLKAVPAVINWADELKGFKEGRGDKTDTVYIFFDPRCPYCREVYNMTRKHVASGRISIKWIPVSILNDSQDPKRGARLAATILQNDDPAFLERVLGRKEDIQSSPAPETLKAIDDNERFMDILFRYGNRGAIGVPAALYLDHREGRAKLKTGISEPIIFNDIFGQL